MSSVGRVVAWICAGAGLPLTLVAVQQGAAEPWYAILGLVVYELMVGAVTMVASVAQQTMRHRLEQAANVADLALGRRVSRYARHYRRYVLEQNAHINAKDLAHTPSRVPELDAVYVDVGLMPGSPSSESGGLLPTDRDDGRERRSIQEFLNRDKAVVLAVIGAPGSGKTTLLRHAASRAANAKRREQRRRIPVMLALRDHVVWIADGGYITLGDLIRKAVGDLEVAEPKDWWEAQLREGNCLILLDGLDEVARKEDRASVSEWIERQIAKHPRNDFVVTSRPHGYRTAVIPQAVVLQARPFTTEQVRRFVRAWCLETQRITTGKVGPDIERLAQEEADDLLGQLVAAPVLQEFAVNPLLLTMMVLVHRERRVLPAGRAELYHQVCDVMLWRRQESKRLQVDPSGPVRQRMLAAVAFKMMASGTRDFPRDGIIEVFERLLDNMDTDTTPEGLLERLVEDSGMLVERENGMYAFAHHTFTEYLASTHIRAYNLVDILKREVDNPWWREATLLFIADADANEIVEACLERNTGISLSLAFDCVLNHGQLDRRLRLELDAIRRDAFTDNADPSHRRRVARALASGHLSKLVALDNGALVCPDPVPEDLYWLFCQETGCIPPDGFRGLDLSTSRPAKGMWSHEAHTFVSWVNQGAVEENSAMFRLPTVEEADLLQRSGFMDGRGHDAILWTAELSRALATPERWPHEQETEPLSPNQIVLQSLEGDVSEGALLALAALADALMDIGALKLSSVSSDADRMDAELQIGRVVTGIRLATARLSIQRPQRLAEALEIASQIRSSIRAGGKGVELAKRKLARLLIDVQDSIQPIDLGPIFSSPRWSTGDLGHIMEMIFRGVEEEIKPVGPPEGVDEEVHLIRRLDARFANELCARAGLNDWPQRPNLSSDLAREFEVACIDISEKLSNDGDVDRVSGVISTLIQTAAPILRRTVRPQAAEFRIIRVTSLFLAALCIERSHSEHAETFRQVAYVITRLEKRLACKLPLEVLLLARE
jgi:hypothetical protein